MVSAQVTTNMVSAQVTTNMVSAQVTTNMVSAQMNTNMVSAQVSTILDEPIGESNTLKSSGHESKYMSVLYSQLYNYLFIIYPTV